MRALKELLPGFLYLRVVVPGKLAVRFSNSRVPSTYTETTRVDFHLLQRGPREPDNFRAMHSFLADPDPAVFLNADPDQMRIRILSQPYKICKKLHYKVWKKTKKLKDRYRSSIHRYENKS